MFEVLDKILTESNIEDPVKVTGGVTRIGWMISVGVNVVTYIAFGVSFVMLAYAFIQFIISTGDPKKLAVPKSAVTWSIMGLILALALQGIKAIILSTLGYEPGWFF